MTILPCIILIILTEQAENNKEVNLPLFVGIGVEFMYVIYFSLIGYLFWSGSRSSKGRNIFRIWTKSGPSMYYAIRLLFNLLYFINTSLINK